MAMDADDDDDEDDYDDDDHDDDDDPAPPFDRSSARATTATNTKATQRARKTEDKGQCVANQAEVRPDRAHTSYWYAIGFANPLECTCLQDSARHRCSS